MCCLRKGSHDWKILAMLLKPCVSKAYCAVLCVVKTFQIDGNLRRQWCSAVLVVSVIEEVHELDSKAMLVLSKVPG